MRTCFILALLPTVSLAAEYRIGVHQRHGMEIAAVYLQPVDMEPGKGMRKAAESDIHLEADIRALSGNSNGFGKDTWIPYLSVHYEIRGKNEWRATGRFMPMVANDGPHYGDNVKLAGPGKYHLTLTVLPPNATASSTTFGRHVDRLTGVSPWFSAFSVEYEFMFAGIGKKGGY